MIKKKDIIAKARELEFGDVGFTSAEPFEEHKKYLLEHQDEYGWAEKTIGLSKGIDPKEALSDAKTIIVLIELYFRKSYPSSLEGHFGRCYLDDDRIKKDGLALRVKAFRSFLRENGIESKVPGNLPHRMAAARAGLGTLGKNCLFYSNNAGRQSSWNLPITVVVDQYFEHEDCAIEIGCPDWCKNTCISACPTGALTGAAKLDPRKCISYLSYFGEGLTPMEMREPMGLQVYGCDRCQNVCPRNRAWLAQDLPENRKVLGKAGDFTLDKLLHMDKEYFESKIWPNMFYMSYDDIWRWKMNAARAMGNSLDEKYIPDLAKGFTGSDDERVKSMCAWALGRIRTDKCRDVLEQCLSDSKGIVRDEVAHALARFK